MTFFFFQLTAWVKGPTLTLCPGPLNFSGRPCHEDTTKKSTLCNNYRRQVSSITLLYKIVHNLIDISPVDLIPVTSNTRGHDQRFHHIYARTNQYSNSFFPRSIRLWNSLPPDLIQQQSLQIFKYQLKLLLLSPTNQ